jgi:transmembrane sensor
VSNVINMPPTHQRYDEASRWIARLDKNWSADDSEALQRWMAADPENQAVLLSMVKLWDKMDALSRLSDLFPHRVRRRTRLPQHSAAMAASLLVAVLMGIGAFLAIDRSELPGERTVAESTTPEEIYETEVGKHSTVTLYDGTQVSLNTNSLLRVSYTSEHRLLTLERGEIHVRVAVDRARPLSVIAGDNVVQSIGTEFNIEITDDQHIELVVTEGKVRIAVRRRTDKDSQFVTQANLPPVPVTVVAGETWVLGRPDEEITKISADDIKVKLSWRNGNLIFRGESLEEAVKEIGRYTSVEFVILDDDLRKVRVAGLFKAGDVDGLLVALRENFDIAYQRVDDKTVLLSGQ